MEKSPLKQLISKGKLNSYLWVQWKKLWLKFQTLLKLYCKTNWVLKKTKLKFNESRFTVLNLRPRFTKSKISFGKKAKQFCSYTLSFLDHFCSSQRCTSWIEGTYRSVFMSLSPSIYDAAFLWKWWTT